MAGKWPPDTEVSGIDGCAESGVSLLDNAGMVAEFAVIQRDSRL
jgi:hypothetical protein